MTAASKVWPAGAPVFTRTFAERAGDTWSVKDFRDAAEGVSADYLAFQRPGSLFGIGKVDVTIRSAAGVPLKDADGKDLVIKDDMPTADRPGGHIRVPTGQYVLNKPVFTQPGIGMELDTGACFTGKDNVEA